MLTNVSLTRGTTGPPYTNSYAECLQNRRPNGLDVGRALTPIEFDHLLSRTRRQLFAQLGIDADIHVGTPLKLASVSC